MDKPKTRLEAPPQSRAESDARKRAGLFWGYGVTVGRLTGQGCNVQSIPKGVTMASMLGSEIKAIQSKALEVHAPRIVKYFMDLAKDCGEYGESLETATVHLHPGDGSDDVWESLAVLTDCFSPTHLAEIVGIVVKYNHATHAEIQWSGK